MQLKASNLITSVFVQNDQIIPHWGVKSQELYCSEVIKADDVFSAVVTAAALKRIKASRFVVFNLLDGALLRVRLDDLSVLAWDLNCVGREVGETLIHHCLHKKIVLGHGLAYAYAWCYEHAKDWTPDFTLDTLALARALRPDITIPRGPIDALALFCAIGQANNFEAAFCNVLDMDAAADDIYYETCENVPFGLVSIIADAMDHHAAHGGEVQFAASLQYDAESDSYTVYDALKKPVYTFDAERYEACSKEIDAVMDHVIAIITGPGSENV